MSKIKKLIRTLVAWAILFFALIGVIAMLTSSVILTMTFFVGPILVHGLKQLTK